MTIRLYLSGGATNGSGLASLGGAISVNQMPSRMFTPITSSQFSSGRVMYRCLYVHTDEDSDDVTAWVAIDTPSASTGVAIGWGVSAIDGTEASILNETIAPSGVSFSSAASQGAGLNGGDFSTNQFRALWVRYTINAGTALIRSETFRISIVGTATDSTSLDFSTSINSQYLILGPL